MSWIQWGGEALQGIHVVWPSHLLHQKLHLNLKREGKNESVNKALVLEGFKKWTVSTACSLLLYPSTMICLSQQEKDASQSTIFVLRGSTLVIS